jgi:hypothetical protein
MALEAIAAVRGFFPQYFSRSFASDLARWPSTTQIGTQGFALNRPKPAGRI